MARELQDVDYVRGNPAVSAHISGGAARARNPKVPSSVPMFHEGSAFYAPPNVASGVHMMTKGNIPRVSDSLARTEAQSNE